MYLMKFICKSGYVKLNYLIYMNFTMITSIVSTYTFPWYWHAHKKNFLN